MFTQDRSSIFSRPYRGGKYDYFDYEENFIFSKGEERDWQTEVYPPEIAKSFGCRFESNRSEVVKMFAKLGVGTSAIILAPLFRGDSIGVDLVKREGIRLLNVF